MFPVPVSRGCKRAQQMSGQAVQPCNVQVSSWAWKTCHSDECSWYGDEDNCVCASRYKMWNAENLCAASRGYRAEGQLHKSVHRSSTENVCRSWLYLSPTVHAARQSTESWGMSGSPWPCSGWQMVAWTFSEHWVSRKEDKTTISSPSLLS